MAGLLVGRTCAGPATEKGRGFQPLIEDSLNDFVYILHPCIFVESSVSRRRMSGILSVRDLISVLRAALGSVQCGLQLILIIICNNLYEASRVGLCRTKSWLNVARAY